MSSQDFKEFERRAWEAKATRYQDTWGTVTMQPAQRILDISRVGSNSKVLDCGCGAGHFSAEALKRGALVTGCDYSHEMIRLAHQNYPQISFVHQDAENLTFADASFDVVFCNYLFLHLSNPLVAIREARRVLKPQGQLIFTLWLPPQESPGLSIIFKALNKFADPSVIPPAEDLFMLASKERAQSVLSQEGFDKIACEVYPTDWRFESGVKFFEAIQAGTRMGGMIDLQTDEVKEKIKESIVCDVEAYRGRDCFIIPTPSIIVSSVKA